MKKFTETIYEIKTISNVKTEAITARIDELELQIDKLAEEWESGKANKKAAAIYFQKTKPLKDKITKYKLELEKRANDPAKIKLKKIEKKVITFIDKLNSIMPSSGAIKSH